MARSAYHIIRCFDSDLVVDEAAHNLFNYKTGDTLLGKYADFVQEVSYNNEIFFVLTKVTMRAGVGTDDPKTRLDVAGDFAYRFFTGIYGPGQIDDAYTADESAIYLDDPTADFMFTGFANPADGKELIVYNPWTAYTMTIAHEHAGSVAANRIHALDGQDLVITGEGLVKFKYSGVAQRWLLVGYAPDKKWNDIYRPKTRRVDFYSGGVVVKTFDEVMIFERYDAALGKYIAQYGFIPEYDPQTGSTLGCNSYALFHYRGTEHGNVYIDGLSPTGPDVPDYWYSAITQFKTGADTSTDYRLQGQTWSEDKGDLLHQRFLEVANPKRRIYVGGRAQCTWDVGNNKFTNFSWKSLTSPEYQISDDECKSDSDLGILGAARFLPALSGVNNTCDIILAWDPRFRPVGIMGQGWFAYARDTDDHLFQNGIDVQWGLNPIRNQQPNPGGVSPFKARLTWWVNDFAGAPGARHTTEAAPGNVNAQLFRYPSGLWHFEFWGTLEIYGEVANVL